MLMIGLPNATQDEVDALDPATRPVQPFAAVDRIALQARRMTPNRFRWSRDRLPIETRGRAFCS